MEEKDKRDHQCFKKIAVEVIWWSSKQPAYSWSTPMIRVRILLLCPCNNQKDAVWPDWSIYCTLGNFSKPLATIILPKSPTFFVHFYNEIIFGQLLKWNHFWATFIDIWWFLTGHTGNTFVRFKSLLLTDFIFKMHCLYVKYWQSESIQLQRKINDFRC